MKKRAVGLLISLMILGLFFQQSSWGQDSKRIEVPQDFAYPVLGAVTEIETPIRAGLLAGKVVDGTGTGLEKVLVEQVTSDWKTRVDATFTDAQGRFYLSSPRSGMYYLKFSLKGYGPVLTRIKVAKKSKAKIKIELPLGS